MLNSFKVKFNFFGLMKMIMDDYISMKNITLFVKSLVLYSLLASLTAIFSFTEIVTGTLVIARMATLIFVFLYMLGILRIIQPYLKSAL